MPPRPMTNTTIESTPFIVSCFDTDPGGDGWSLVFGEDGLTIEKNGSPIGNWVYHPDEATTVQESDFDEVFS